LLRFSALTVPLKTYLVNEFIFNNLLKEKKKTEKASVKYVFFLGDLN
jgi:hypothetical protein